jgi:hypothetical protein
MTLAMIVFLAYSLGLKRCKPLYYSCVKTHSIMSTIIKEWLWRLKMTGETEPRKIMTKPLPQILDEIETSIKMADDAANSARQAAEEARKAGEKAAQEAARVAAQAIAKLERKVDNVRQLAELLEMAIKDGVGALEKRLSQE